MYILILHIRLVDIVYYQLLFILYKCQQYAICNIAILQRKKNKQKLILLHYL